MAITIAEFEAALDAHGSDLGRWPAEIRIVGEALLATSPEARQLLSAAQAVDTALSSPAPKAPQGLADRIIGKALGERDPD